MISKGCFWRIFNIIIKFLFRAFLHLNPLTVHVISNSYWEHTLIKVTGNIKLVHEIGLVCDHSKYAKRQRQLSWEMIVFANVYPLNRLQSENKRPITWEMLCLVKEGQIPVTLFPIWETLTPMTSKVNAKRFYSTSWLDTWTCWLLVILCCIPRVL